MADYLTVSKAGVPFDKVRIEKLYHITGETQRYRVMVGFYTEEIDICFCLTKDELKDLKAQIEAVE